MYCKFAYNWSPHRCRKWLTLADVWCCFETPFGLQRAKLQFVQKEVKGRLKLESWLENYRDSTARTQFSVATVLTVTGKTSTQDFRTSRIPSIFSHDLHSRLDKLLLLGPSTHFAFELQTSASFGKSSYWTNSLQGSLSHRRHLCLISAAFISPSYLRQHLPSTTLYFPSLLLLSLLKRSLRRWRAADAY